MKYLFRFFIVAPPVPPLMVTTFAVLVVIAAGVLLIDPGRGAAAVMPVVVLQLFACASGFATPARRGHYDLLLTRGEGRVRLALAHWLLSVAPGAAAWLAIGVIELTVADEGHLAVFSSGTCAALALVSTLPWTMGVALPRFAPSIGWVLVLVMVASLAPAGVLDSWLRTAAGSPASHMAAAVFLLYPLSVVGRGLNPQESVVVGPGLLVAGFAMVVACRWIRRADFPLEAAQ